MTDTHIEQHPKNEPEFFYGSRFIFQGMEDTIVFDEILKAFPNDRAKAFEEYSNHRNPDAEAICDLAMYNYIEVRAN